MSPLWGQAAAFLNNRGAFMGKRAPAAPNPSIIRLLPPEVPGAPPEAALHPRGVSPGDSPPPTFIVFFVFFLKLPGFGGGRELF